MRCAVYGCCVNNNNNKNKTDNEEISYHSFPKQSKICKQWVILCRRKDKFNTKTARICCKHFKNSDFVPINPLYEQYGIVLKTKRLKEEAVPSLLLPFQKNEKVTSARDLRIQNRSLISSDALIDVHDKKNIELEVDCSTRTDASKVDCSTQVEPLAIDSSTQTAEIIPTYSQLLKQIVQLKAKNLKQQEIIDSLSQSKKLESPHKRYKRNNF